MGVVGGDDLIVVTLAQQPVDVAGTVPFAGVYGAGGIDDFQSSGGGHREQILIGQVVPRGMGSSHVGAGGFGPFRQLGSGLLGIRRRKVARQTDGQNMPRIPQTGRRSRAIASKLGG